MLIKNLYIMIGALAGVLACTYVFIIYTKMIQNRRNRLQQMHMTTIQHDLNKLLTIADSDYAHYLEEYLTAIQLRVKNRSFRTALETALLDHLAEARQEDTQRLLAVAYALNFPSLCMSQIRSRSNRNVAFGSRKAGLFQYKEAIPFMLDALSIFSSDTQFQILMGLSRMGDVDAMETAYNKIGNYVMVNERSVYEIMEAFTGDMRELCRRMIHCEMDFISALFLKSLDRDTAIALSEDIMDIIKSGGKEQRIAAIKAIALTEDGTYARHLLPTLEDSDWEVRAISARTLGKIKVPEVSGALSSAIYDSEWWVRQNAASSLLSYPDCEEIFTSVMDSKDSYAKDSVIFALENAGRNDMLAIISQAPKGLDELDYDSLNHYKGKELVNIV